MLRIVLSITLTSLVGFVAPAFAEEQSNAAVEATPIQSTAPAKFVKALVSGATTEAKLAEKTANAKPAESAAVTPATPVQATEVTVEKTLVKPEASVKPDVQATAEPRPLESANVVQNTHPDLQVLDFVLASGIEAREPKAVVEGFTKEDAQAYAYARLSTAKISDVTFVWYRNGKEQTRFKTTVQAAKKWRTYSSVKLKAGEWKVQLVSADNEVLAEKTFVIQ